MVFPWSSMEQGGPRDRDPPDDPPEWGDRSRGAPRQKRNIRIATAFRALCISERYSNIVE
ncbi:hypothetical protein GCM10010961_41750 [Pseudodonghicola xiamenensis]|uniref:Uncharacterized protein n=1 Tax=Pseudodonghicola xiamenensis TaxID=337702 RepID=A0A8J3HCY5_9RHOB|nr:hypothetical protein GCM10010961_41750 [Pseudodonghicola xiamenensis]